MSGRLPKWMFKATVVSFSVLVGAGIGCAATFYLQAYLPGQLYASAYEGELASLNTRLMSFQGNSDFKRAERSLYQTLQTRSGSKNPVAYYLLGSLFEAQGQEQKASQTYQAFLKLSDSNLFNQLSTKYLKDDVLASLAILYYKKGERSQAANLLSKVQYPDAIATPTLEALQNVLEDPERADFHFDLAKAFRQQLDIPMAQKEFQLALAKSHDPALKAKVGNLLASKMPLKVKALTPLSRYLCLAASEQEENGGVKNAIATYETALSQSPEFEWGYQQIAHLYQEAKDYKNAKLYANKALALNSKLYLSRLTLADIALAEENYPEAKFQFENAREILKDLDDDYHQPLLMNVENQLGFTAEMLQMSREAVGHYKSALAIGTDLPTADSDDLSYARDGARRAELRLSMLESEPNHQG